MQIYKEKVFKTLLIHHEIDEKLQKLIQLFEWMQQFSSQLLIVFTIALFFTF